jgi:hypothetical protein
MVALLQLLKMGSYLGKFEMTVIPIRLQNNIFGAVICKINTGREIERP